MKSLIQHNTSFDNLPLFLSTEDAAILLGCSQALVRQLCSSGQLPCKKVGRAFKIFRGNLISFFAEEQLNSNTLSAKTSNWRN